MADEVLSSFRPTEYKAAPENVRELKFAIVGTGWIAESYAESIINMPGVRVVAAADWIEGKAERFCERYGLKGVRYYRSHSELLENEADLDAVCVCTFNTQHAPCAIDALNKGINVLLEKPMTVTLEEALAVCRAEKTCGKLLSLGFQPRMDANMQMIKQIVDSGELGRIYYIQTGGGRRRGIPNSTFIEKKTAGIGALGDIGCYSLDMVLHAVGYPKPLTISAKTTSFFGANPKYNSAEDAARFDVDDFASAYIRLEGDIILDFRIAWAMHIDTPGDTIIMGTEGALRIPSTECWNGSVGGPMTLYKDVAGNQVEVKIPLQPEEDSFRGLFYKKIESFANAIRENGKAPVPSDEILINQAIIDGIARSSKLGKEIEITIPEI